MEGLTVDDDLSAIPCDRPHPFPWEKEKLPGGDRPVIVAVGNGLDVNPLPGKEGRLPRNENHPGPGRQPGQPQPGPPHLQGPLPDPGKKPLPSPDDDHAVRQEQERKVGPDDREGHP